MHLLGPFWHFPQDFHRNLMEIHRLPHPRASGRAYRKTRGIQENQRKSTVSGLAGQSKTSPANGNPRKINKSNTMLVKGVSMVSMIIIGVGLPERRLTSQRCLNPLELQEFPLWIMGGGAIPVIPTCSLPELCAQLWAKQAYGKAFVWTPVICVHEQCSLSGKGFLGTLANCVHSSDWKKLMLTRNRWLAWTPILLTLLD